MASKSVIGGKAATRLEIEIEKCRDESNWKKLSELVDQLRSRSASGFELLALFLLGESKLEQYFEENEPSEQNISKARTSLNDAKRYLLSVVNDPTVRGGQTNFIQEAWLLLGKIHYAMGMYEETLSNFQNADLISIPEKSIANRTQRVAAESYAIKGLCLEKVPPTSTSKYKLAEREEQIVQCFETASELTLLYLQERDKLQGQSSTAALQPSSSMSGSASPLPSITEHRLGYILEIAVQRAPIIHIKNGDLNRAISQYRNMLTAVESSGTQNLRLTLARQLAEVFLRGVSEAAYHKMEPPTFPETFKGSNKLISATDSPWKPRRYSGTNLFTPKDENEEVILLLLICEAMAVREAVLSRSPEHKEARIHSYNNTTAVYDLLVITLVRRAQFGVLCESFERSMKFSFEEFHIWFQFALSLISASKHSRALLVLKECIRLEPNNSLPCLLATKLCLEYLELIDESIVYAQLTLDRDKTNSQGLSARALLCLGLAYTIKAEKSHQQQERQEFLRKAFENYHKALQIDSNDYLVEYYLALHYAQARQIPEAIFHVKVALSLRSEHVNSLHLLVLLLSAQKQYEEALQLVEASLEEYPENLNLMYTKAHLEEYCNGGEVALLTSKQMLKLWKATYEEQTMGDANAAENHRGLDTRSVFQLYSSEVSDRDSSSLHAHSVAASRVEHALSEVASSMSSYQPRPGPQQAWLLQIQIWLLLARLYLKMNQVSEANACIQEASSIFPVSHHIMYLRGLVHEHNREFQEAKVCYQNAIAINPLHIKSLQHLGLVYHYLGSNALAEKTLRDAVKIDPMAHKSWFNMGQVLSAMREADSASDCFATAIDLEATSPILPFSTIPRNLE